MRKNLDDNNILQEEGSHELPEIIQGRAASGSMHGHNENSSSVYSGRRRPKDDKIPFSSEVSIIIIIIHQ